MLERIGGGAEVRVQDASFDVPVVVPDGVVGVSLDLRRLVETRLRR